MDFSKFPKPPFQRNGLQNGNTEELTDKANDDQSRQTTTCDNSDADEVSSLCSLATAEGDYGDADRYLPVAPPSIGDDNIDSQVCGQFQDGVSNGVNNAVSNTVPPAWPIYGTYVAAVPVMCYVIPQNCIVFGSDGNTALAPFAQSLHDTTSTKSAQIDRSKAHRGKEGPERTTIILRDLPIECGRDMLLQILDSEGFWGCYDFVHLPVDFQTKAGLGYALLNLVTHKAAVRVKDHFSGFAQWPFPGHVENGCTVAWNTPQQGLAANIDRYRNSPLMHKSVPEAYRPLLFKNGERVQFPAPTTRLRAPRIRHSKPNERQ